MRLFQGTRLAVAAAALAVAGAAPAQAQDEELCGMIAAAICGNDNLAPCFQHQGNWAYVPPICEGFVQMSIEMEREAMQSAVGGGTTAWRDTGASPAGTSYGGVLREGPGTGFRRFGSLVEGDWLDVLEPTGVWSDGYQWYRVDSPVGVGFHWGGIFCTQGVVLEGVLGAC